VCGVQNNPVLGNVDGLSSLSSVAGDLFIAANNVLMNITIPRLKHMDGDVLVSGNHVLATMSLCELSANKATATYKLGPKNSHLYAVVPLYHVK